MKKIQCKAFIRKTLPVTLSPFNQPGLKTACADMKPLVTAIHFTLNSLDIGLPNCVGSSMRMAYIVTEMNSLATNITFSHLDTSSTPAHTAHIFIHNRVILTEIFGKSK